MKKDGVHKWQKKEEVITKEQQMMMDTQDKKYVNHKLTVETKVIMHNFVLFIIWFYSYTDECLALYILS